MKDGEVFGEMALILQQTEVCNSHQVNLQS